MVDVWWGLTEASPKVYNFSAYRQLFEMARVRGWKVQAVASFHQCGGNVGDNCNIPLPDFVRSVDGIWYKDAQGEEDREYISLFADHVYVGGRTPLDMYRDWLDAFAAEFSDDLGSLIEEVMVGMGPCGELRYPSYRLSHWQFCGHGQFQAFDGHALENLQAAAASAQHPEWGAPPGLAITGTYNSRPHETEFFTSGFKSDYGKFFMEWYSSALKVHGRRVLASAKSALQGKANISGKVAGIHWWYDSDSHAAEVTAGYYNTNLRDAYDELAQVFAEQGAALDFTCLEMRNTEQPQDCHSNPEGLVQQTMRAAEAHGIHYGGENALQRYDRWAYEQMESYKDHLSALTYLRLNSQLTESGNLALFRDFVSNLHGTSPSAASVSEVGNPSAASVSEVGDKTTPALRR